MQLILRLATALGFLVFATMPVVAKGPLLAGSLSKDIALWQAYSAQFVMPDGRVIDNVNGGISHTESQGYGMLLAVAAGDVAAFERIWSFTQSKMYVREDGLGAWKFVPDASAAASNDANGLANPVAGQITDMNNATDGDILIAWALAEAGAAGFGDQYSQNASDIAKALRSTVYDAGSFGLQMKPGMIGFSAEERDGKPVVNPSYWVFPAFERLAVLAPQAIWPELSKSGLAHIQAAKEFPAGLLPDWISLDQQNGTRGLAAGFDDAYSYNAIRIPLYLAMTGPKSRRMLRASFENWFAVGGPLKTVGVNDRALRDSLSDPGYEAIRSIYKCATSSTPFPIEALTSLDVNYYPATLQLLAIIAARQSFPKCI